MLIRKCVLKLGATHCASGGPHGHVEIEVASKRDGDTPIVSPGIVQGLVKLGAAQPIITFAFQVQVIGDDRFSRDAGIANQGQASSDSFLKRLYFGKEPVRAPSLLQS